MRDADLESLERDVATAIRARDISRLHLLGHGEISVALGWPHGSPTVACKRLPPFADRAAFDAYAGVVQRYVSSLEAGGVRVVETQLRAIDRPDGRVIGFHLQPVLDADTLGTEIMRRTSPADGHPIIDAVVDVVASATTAQVGIDAQMSNWSWRDGEPWLLDLTTPFMVDSSGAPSIDLEPFLAVLPAVLLPLLRKEMVKQMHRYLTPRGALVDLAANVRKAHLEAWLPTVLSAVERRTGEVISVDEIERRYREDARLWPVLFRMERWNRTWQEKVRRRPFEFLLPDHSTYEA